MNSSAIKVKKEFDDLPEDNPDLVDLKQIRHLTGAESEISSFDSFQVKTELKEESEENRFAREDIEMVTDYMSNGVEENVNCKTRKKLLNRTKIKCEQCGVMCRDKNGYKLHVMDHTGERPFKCSLCEKSYKKSMDLTYHMISHTDADNDCKSFLSDGETKPEIEIKIESLGFENKSKLKKEKKKIRKIFKKKVATRHKSEPYFQCGLCDKPFKKKYNLLIHIKAHTGNHDHHCELCGKGFTVRSALRAHMRTHTKDKPYVCPVCGRGFSHSSSLKPHIAIHSDECPFECDRCDRKFKTKKTLTHHIQSHDLDEGKGLQCGICFKFYKSKESIRIHLKIHRHEEGGDQNSQMHSCDQCGNTYKHLISLKNHMRYHTNDMFECHMCDKAYVDKNHLRIHLRNHTGETPYTCEICSRKFRRRDSFMYHKTTHESDRKTFKCDLCDKVLVCKSSLRAHHILIHSTEKKHQCKLCQQRFKMRYELTKHVRKHKENGGFPKENRVERNGAVPKTEKDLDKGVCLICQKDCGEEGLDAHMASHDVKPLKCECTRLFYGKREYKKHLRGGCEVIGKDLELVGQKRVKREARIKKELKKESDG